MALWGWIVIGVLVAIALVVALTPSRMGGGEPDLTQVSISPDLDAELRYLVSNGQPVLAVKRLREESGLSLSAAHTIIKRMQSAEK